MKKIFLIFFCLLHSFSFSQNEIKENKFKFIAYKKIPAWVGVIDEWQKADPKVYIYDFGKYIGHSEFYSRGLKTGVTFKQFKTMVSVYATRKCLPFFLYDIKSDPMTVNGEKFNYALRLEDYSYTDDPTEMLNTVVKALKSVENRIFNETGKKEKVLMVLYSGKTQKPNVELTENLNLANKYSIPISKLMEHFKAAKIEVLNPGIAYGYLRYVKTDSTDQVKLDRHDIVIYERIPVKVPIVAAFITLEPQTPLSHVNLLATNRKTPNLYVGDLNDLSGSDKLLGKLVKLQCNSKKIALTETSLPEAQASWSKQQFNLQIPAADTSLAGIIDLSNSTIYSMITPSLVGAKAANYKLLQASFPTYVNKGFAIGMVHYFRMIRSCGAEKLILKLSATNKFTSTEIDSVLNEIRDRIAMATIDSVALKGLTELMNTQLSGKKIRIRSSTNCEDLPRFNGAGLYFSTGIKPNEKIAAIKYKLLQVYASLWTRTAYDERNYYGIDQSKVGMAILINEAFENEFANGVVLTIPEAQGVSVLIDTQSGDHLVTNPGSGDVPEEILFHTSYLYQVRTRSNINDVFLQNEELKNKLLELQKLSLQIHQLLIGKIETEKDKYGVDIEFKIIENEGAYKLMIKQARMLYTPLPVE